MNEKKKIAFPAIRRYEPWGGKNSYYFKKMKEVTISGPRQ